MEDGGQSRAGSVAILTTYVERAIVRACRGAADSVCLRVHSTWRRLTLGERRGREVVRATGIRL